MAIRLWSLWDMLTLNARHFAILVTAIYGAEQVSSGKTGPLPNAIKDVLKRAVKDIVGPCQELHLPMAEKAAQALLNRGTAEQLEFGWQYLRETLFTELEGRKFYGPETEYAQYFENAQLFGLEVFNAFPRANDDVTEAGNCLALERSTACVMHLMRAAEVALRALAKALGVP